MGKYPSKAQWFLKGEDAVSLTKGNKSVFFDVKRLKTDNIKIDFSYHCDVFVILDNSKLTIQLIFKKETTCRVSHADKLKTIVLKPDHQIKL